MVKFAASLLLLLVAYCVEGNDFKCVTNGIFANPEDCSTYNVCVDGKLITRNCPEGFLFDHYRHCTFPEEADCGKGGPYELSCPEMYGYFEYEKDCQKYVVCVDGVPHLRECPEGQWYLGYIGCIDGDKCPQRPSSN